MSHIEPANSPLTRLYDHSLSLLNDLYQLTMAYGYWKLGRDRQEAVFHLSFRRPAFESGFSIACGLHYVIDFLQHLKFEPDDLQYLASLKGNDDQPLFEKAFLDYLAELHLQLDIDAVPEGTVIFPHEPLVRVTGPILHAQLVETPLLNMINFQTLIATKAARVCLAAEGDPVIEFGLRRAQGIDGGVAASRAAYVGGCAGTSNLLAGRLFDIPVKGTHAHSWVMSFDSELESFAEYAKAMPNNCVFLVDTYNTLEGVRHAAEIGQRLRRAGHRLAGIRLDSGDLAYLSIEARKILDEAGLPDASILASNELDEKIINSLKQQGAKINVWGVGTRLATAYDQPALGGVYKLSAVRPIDQPNGPWQYKLKLSEQSAKISIPGVLQVRRFMLDGECIADAIYDTSAGALPGDPSAPKPADEWTIIDPNDLTRQKTIPAAANAEDLLVPIYRGGKLVYDPPPIAESRRRAQTQLAQFHPGIKRMVNPHLYPVGLEKSLFNRRTQLILEARRQAGKGEM